MNLLTRYHIDTTISQPTRQLSLAISIISEVVLIVGIEQVSI